MSEVRTGRPKQATEPAAEHGSLDLVPVGPDAATTRRTEPAGDDFPVNEVRLTGRISSVAEPVAMPSGDTVVNLRLVVARDAAPGRSVASRRAPGVDTIDVACWSAATQRAVTRAGAGAEVQLTGVLRRRFFRAGSGPASRYEVEARRVRRLRRPA